jgi:hypothetical protein
MGAEISTYEARFFALIGSTSLRPKPIQHQYNWHGGCVLPSELIGSRAAIELTARMHQSR